MKITINSSCRENWSAMKPNEQGAFCLSCQKNVIDFSVKTIDEIKAFFTSLPEEHSVCARFEETQLTALSFDHFFKDFLSWKYFQKAALITFFVFGMSLFGQAQASKKSVMVKGEVAVVIPPDTGRVKCAVDTNRYIMGGPKYIPDTHPKQKKQPIMGKPSVDMDRRKK